ncbi:MAG TPA: type II toxin-antitoxin system CcdA family antitoxin [Verrucomicrobiae bacterium]|nr:type II toxin-antitoxin system CcdA family antitoxin [Verrucomicrobiae bacterium]
MRILLRMAKTAVNLSVSEVVLREARALKLNLSQVFEEGLREHLRRKRAEKWQEENKDAIKAFNDRIERDGLLSDDFRPF